MNNDNGRIYYATGLDNSQLRADAAQARSILAGVGTSAAKEGDRIDAAMKKIGASIAGVFAVQQVKDFIVQVANVRGQFQQLEAAFKVLTGDAAVAESLMSQLIHTAAVTPFGVTDITQAAKQLLAYGVEADKVNETLIRLGDICAGLSIPIGDLAYLYGTTMTQGRLYTADLNQFLGRGIPLADELAKQFGVAKEEIRKMVEEGKVGFPEVQQAIINLTNEGGKFGGLMKELSGGITQRISNIKDSIEQMFNEIGKSSEGAIGVTLDGITAVVENWEKIGKVLLTVIAAYGGYKAAVLLVAAAHKIANIRGTVSVFLSLAKSVTSAKDAMLLFNMATKANPLGIVLGVVGAATAAMWAFSDSTSKAEDAQKRLKAAQDDFNVSVKAEQAEIDRLFDVLRKAKQGTDEYKAAKDSIINKYGQYLSGLDKEIATLQDVEGAYKAVTAAARESARVRAIENATTEAQSEYGRNYAENAGKLRDALAENAGKETATRLMKQVQKELKATGRVADATKEKIGDALRGDFSYGSSKAWITGLERNEQELANAYGRINDLFQKAGSPATGDSPRSNVTEEIGKATGRIKELEREIAELRSGKLQAEAGKTVESAIESRVKELQAAQRTLETLTGRETPETTANDSGRTEDQTAERTQKIDEYKNAVIAANAEAELEIRQRQIENMDEGYEKQKEQIKLNYDRLIAENKKRGQDMIDALADEKVLEWQNKHPNATKAETIAYRASLSLTVADLAPEQREQIEAYNDLALKAMIKGNRQLVEQQEAAWNEYYAKYGDYMQRRNAIAAKYDAELLNAESGSAEEATLLKQKAEELDALDEEMRGSTTLMGQLFADASERSVAEIQKIIDKAELLMDWLGAQKDAKGAATIDGKTVTRGDILGLSVSENTLQGLERSPEKVESLRNGIARLKGELGSRSPFKRLEEDIKAAAKAIKDGNVAEGVAKIGSAVSAFAPALGEFGQSLGTIFGSDELGAKIAGVADALGGVGQTAAGVGQIMSGDVVGGAMAAVNGIGKVVGALDGLFGADYSEYEALKGQYDQLTEVWDDLIAKKKEYIDIDYGAEAQKAGQEALDLLEKEAEATRNLLAARGSSGSSWGSRSIAGRTNEDLGGWLAELRKYTHVQRICGSSGRSSTTRRRTI